VGGIIERRLAQRGERADFVFDFLARGHAWTESAPTDFSYSAA
jgi:hypothetical protein